MSTSAHHAILKALDTIDESEFDTGPDGWHDEIATALIDAVFSMRARYDSPTPGRGVFNRVKAFREGHPDKHDDLRALKTLGEHELIDIMGSTQTAGRSKASAAIEAAEALTDKGIYSAADLTEGPLKEAKKAYTGVHGLGWITFEYFLMLLGKPGVKADTMITRFVNAALAEEALPPVDAQEAHRLITEVFDQHKQEHWGGLTALDHTIWRFQRGQ